ncbi:MAG: hypothetical protein HDT25_11210 [Ruminococcus sp.]|nr:hypothetical protein [Ruminococcus sp.]
MNFSILITIIIFAIILGVVVYHITKENKGLTVLTEMIIIIISILVSWLKTDDNEIEYTSNPITTTVETLEQTEPKTDNLTSHKNTTTSEATQIEITTTTEEITSTTTTQTTTIEETQKVDPNYLFEIPNPEEIDLMSGSLSGNYSDMSGQIHYTPTKSGIYGFIITHNSPYPESEPKLECCSEAGQIGSIGTKNSKGLRKDYKYQLYISESSRLIAYSDVNYDYEVKMYYPSEPYDIEGSFAGSLLFNGQRQKLYYKPLVSGEYFFNFKNYDELCYEFECYKLDTDFPIKSKTIKKERDKLTIDLIAGETYEIRITSKDILQGRYEVTIS